MKLTEPQKVGGVAESEVEACLRANGCATSKVLSDFGEDLSVEIPHQDDLRGARVLIQVKGTSKPIAAQEGRVNLGRFNTDLLRKWQGTVTPVAVVRWNINEQIGYFAFVNTPVGAVREVKRNQTTQTVYASSDDLLSRDEATHFMTAALIANRVRLDLLCGISDFDGDRKSLPLEVTDNTIELMVQIGFMQAHEAGGERTFNLSGVGKQLVVDHMMSLSENDPSASSADIVRRAIVYSFGDLLQPHGAFSYRVILNCLKASPAFVPVKDLRSQLEEWGHPPG